MRGDSPEIDYKRQLPQISKAQGFGLISLGLAVFAGGVYVNTFSWVVSQLMHPVHLFDYPPGECNYLWIFPCTLSIICGLLSRKTIWGKLGIVFSILVLLGIILMVRWGVQYIPAGWCWPWDKHY